MPITVRDIEPGDFPAWDEFVTAHPQGSPFHLIAWKKTIEEVFRYRPQYLAAFDGSTIAGALPLFLVSNWITGKALISTPFSVYGGALASSDESRAALSEYVEKFARALDVQYVELRNTDPGQRLGYSSVDRYVTFRGPVSADEEAVLQSIPRKTRRIVRKSLEHPYSVHVQKEDIRIFEDLYSRSLRRLGTPAFPRKHFRILLKHFGDSANIREIWLEGKPVAAVLSFYFRDQVLPYYGAADEHYNAQAPTTFMYYDLMRWAGQNGYRTFDFGRSKIDSASGHFKSHWGLVETPLPYEMLLVKRTSLPNNSPTNPMFQYPMKIWRKLPLPLTRAVGPRLLKLFP